MTIPPNRRIMWPQMLLRRLEMMKKLTVAVVVTFAAAAPAAAQTFTKDIAPILQKSCQSCHRPRQVAPMSLMPYQDVRPWARWFSRPATARQGTAAGRAAIGRGRHVGGRPPGQMQRQGWRSGRWLPAPPR